MNVKLAYLGRSSMQGSGAVLNLSPNLARDPVAFDAPLLRPLRFREAISALHDVVSSDLRFKPRDKSAYEQWKKVEEERLKAIRREAYKDAKAEILARRVEPIDPEIERKFEKHRRRYWDLRQRYANYLAESDFELWRLLMPCDPVITVAPDVVFFECFSSDESSYGCLSVNRDAFGHSHALKFGTTNVDYSWELYNHFQSLRTYRETRFRIDPAGFEVGTEGKPGYREEKIDLPPSWLRGFMQIQCAMGLPMRKVELTREAVYSICAYLKRHKAQTSPRALRFEFVQGKPIRLVLEPWEREIIVHGRIHDGPTTEPIRIWGRQRLLVFARLLPLVDGLDVYLLGTGMPHFWVARMGEMRLTLGLSGWTTNDWTQSASLDLLYPTAEVTRDTLYNVSRFVRESKAVTFAEVKLAVNESQQVTAAALNQLAHSGQLIYDLTQGRYRWRQIMPMALGEDQMGPENPELGASRQIIARKRVKVEMVQDAPKGGKLYLATVDSNLIEMMLDADGRMKRAKCPCVYFQRGGLRIGPCRHLLALRGHTMLKGPGAVAVTQDKWYDLGYLIYGD